LHIEYTNSNKPYDAKRAFKFFALGGVYIAPVLHCYYVHLVPRITTSVGLTGVMKKLAFDQTFFATSYLSVLFFNLNILDGKSASEAIDDVKKKMKPAMLANWKFWPFVNFANFYFVPVQYQVLWNNFFAMIFNSYLSYLHNTY
jgi:hypothetical protein